MSVNVGAHPHGYELRLLLNQRFLRSRVHDSLSGVLADATDTRHRFELPGLLRSRSPRTDPLTTRRQRGSGLSSSTCGYSASAGGLV